MMGEWRQSMAVETAESSDLRPKAEAESTLEMALVIFLKPQSLPPVTPPPRRPYLLILLK